MLSNRNSTSIIMYLPGGRLGNMISSYLMMLWVKLENGYIAYLDADTSAVMKRYFENIDMPVLEKSLCDYKFAYILVKHFYFSIKSPFLELFLGRLTAAM